MKLLRLQSLLHVSALVIIAFALRYLGWNWDAGAPWSLHPDERHMAMVTAALENTGHWLDTASSGMNPYNRGIHSYVYGTLPLKMVHAFTVERGITDHRAIVYTGRLFSALWSTGAVLALCLFARRLAGWRTALLAGWCYALTVLSIQQAHFYTVDSAGVFFTTLCIGFGTWALKEKRPTMLALSCACVGLAMACRLNLGLLAFWTTGLTMALTWVRRDRAPVWAWVLGGLTAVLLFRICQPYAFEASSLIPTGLNPRWLEDVRQVRAISHGTLEVPYTLQWIKRIPYLYALQQIVAWGMGWTLGLPACIGAGLLLFRHRFQPTHWMVFPALWAVLLIGYHGGIFLHTLRYFLPAYPALILSGALALRLLPSLELRRITAGIVLAGTALYALAFVNLYREPHPRVQASRWLYEQLPYGGTVASEHWDDALPLRLEDAEELHADLTFLELEVYTRETADKTRKWLQQIEEADYLILSSTRASHSLIRFPERYPVMTRFYQRLAEGETRSGLQEVARFHRQPHLNGWGLDSLRAEEAFRVYDHPLVRIYEKTPVFSVDALFEVLTEDIDFNEIPDIRYGDAGRWNNGRFSPTEWEARQEGQPWEKQFPGQSIATQHPVWTWSILLLLLGLGSYPLAWAAFPSLRDRGAGLSRILGLLLITLLAWWPAAVGWMPFPRSLRMSTFLCFGISAGVAGFHHEALLVYLRQHGKRLWAGESIFWLTFFGFLWVRWLLPDLWHPWAGGEKPMDFAFLNATVLTPYFPAPNPWLSGTFINYYAYGFVLTASLIHSTGLTPDMAYNLAMPTFGALTAGAVFSLARSWTPLFRSRPGWKGELPRGWLAVGLTLFAGNLAQIRWVLSNKTGQYMNAGYWEASRALRVPENEVAPITEFPFFTLLYGDLHAHWMALPLAVFALACAWQLFRRAHALRWGLCALAMGTVWVVNAWDLPVQAAIFIGCALLGVFSVPVTDRVRWIFSRLGWVLLTLFTAYLLYVPSHWKTLSHPAEFELWKGPRSSLLDLIWAHGLFLIPLGIAGALFWNSPQRLSLRKGPRLARLLWVLLLSGCLLLLLGVEIWRLKSDIGRMNTVFKFYYQVWWILSLLTATLLIPLLRFRPIRSKRSLTSAGLLLIPALGLVYPLTAIPARYHDRFWTQRPPGIDGLAYQEQGILEVDGQRIPLQDDRAGLQWLREHAKPFEVLLEAQRPEYQWGGRMSWHTGLPTVLGWNWHMRQQRPRAGADRMVWERAADIRAFYTGNLSPDQQQAFLRRYQIRYVVVGALEAATYGEDVRTRMQKMPQLTIAFEHQTLQIYRVITQAPPPVAQMVHRRPRLYHD